MKAINRTRIDWTPTAMTSARRRDPGEMLALAYLFAQSENRQFFVCRHRFTRDLTIETSETLDKLADYRHPVIEVNPAGDAYLFSL
jgi:hypothetical protein